MNKKQVIEKIGKDRWDEFCKFMVGQTVAIKNNESDYYKWDVENFLRKKENRFWD